ncbi:MAG: DUF1552 domain-containing protein, partial [Myxococcota bacterium]
AGQGNAQKRFVFFVTKLGVQEDYRPTPGPMGVDLNVWTALEPHRNELTVVNRMFSPFDLHLHGNRWFATATQGTGSGGDVLPGGPTFDRYLASQLGAASPIGSITIAAFEGRKGFDTISADGPGVTFPSGGAIENFVRVFGDADSGDAQRDAMARLRRNQSVLDFAVDDISRLQTRLGSIERERLDQYATSVRELETQLLRVSEVRSTCASPIPPDPEAIGSGRDDHRPERMAASLDVFTSALTCGFTNVGVFYLPARGLSFLGEDGEIGSHGMWHGDGTPEKRSIWYNYQAQTMGAIWQALKDTPEGDGTMADHTILLWMNEAGGKHHNGAYESWAMMLGSTGGLRGNQFVELPDSEVTEGDLRRTLATPTADRAPKVGRDAPVHAINDVFVTVGQLLGVGTTSFGDERLVRGVLPVA